MPRYTITNFSRGVFAPELYGRVDVPQYTAGAKEITNFLIQRYGGLAFRPGFRFVGEVDDATKTYRYIPFQFSMLQAYVQVFGDQQMRLLADGGFVTEDDLKITAITKEAHAKITAAHHAMSIGDRIYVDGVSGMTEINGKFGKVLGVPSGSQITTDIDTTNFSTFTSSTGIVRSADPAPPTPITPPAPPPAPPPPPTTTTPNPPPPPTSTGSGTGTYSKGGGAPYYKTYN
jgi:hypothetical protein